MKLTEIERNTCMAVNMTKDMTGGPPIKLILGSFIPMLRGLLLQQLYSMTDIIIVGKCLGVEALVTVGFTGSISFMIIGFCLGVCSGSAIPVTQKFGERSGKAPRRFVADSAWLAVPFSAAATVAVCPLCRNTLELIQTPEDITDGAYNYAFVIFLDIPTTYLYSPPPCTIRSLGDSATPLISLVFSSAVNVALDLFTILVLKTDVSGVAQATITTQTVSGVLCLFYMRKKFDTLKMNDDERGPDTHYIKTLCNMGILAGLQYSIAATGSVVPQITTNSLGSVVAAVVATGNKISMFSCRLFDALRPTMATYGGQNVGARKLDRTDQGLKAGTVMGCVYAVIAFAVLYIFGQRVVPMLVDKGGGEILRNTWLFLISNNLFYIPLVFVNMAWFMIQGLRYSRLAITASVREMAARFFVDFYPVPMLSYMTVCIANPVAWIAVDLFLIPTYRYAMKNLNQLFYGKSRVTDAAQWLWK